MNDVDSENFTRKIQALCDEYNVEYFIIYQTETDDARVATNLSREQLDFIRDSIDVIVDSAPEHFPSDLN